MSDLIDQDKEQEESALSRLARMKKGGLLTVDQAAALLERHPMTIIRMLHRGELRGAFKLGKAKNSHWRIPLSALETYLHSLMPH